MPADSDDECLADFSHGADDEPAYFAVTDEDVKREFPNTLITRTAKGRKVYMTPLFVLEMLQSFYADLNARHVRRHMCALVASHTLSMASAAHQSSQVPYSMAWQLTAMPSNKALAIQMSALVHVCDSLIVLVAGLHLRAESGLAERDLEGVQQLHFR